MKVENAGVVRAIILHFCPAMQDYQCEYMWGMGK